MVHKAALVALALAGTAFAHSSVLKVVGDVGGGMTGLGINPAQPTVDPNKDKIEGDANAMPSTRDTRANGLGTLNNKAKVTMDMLPAAVKNAGETQIPQVNSTMDINYMQIVIDGRCDVTKGCQALIDPTNTANYQQSVPATILVAPDPIKQATIRGTTVVAKAMPMKIQIPDSVTCTGPQNTCGLRIINGQNEGNNHWGAHVVFQKASAGGAAAAGAAAAPAAGNPAGGAAKIQARYAVLEELARELSKRQLPDTILRRDLELTPNPNPTYEDMLKFEADWEAGLISV
ncbi:hypothetical protein P8C59_000899 [Phyllachora maydis]|uniref:Uncharacterized protein n=1 Tax=Phyllachora maydis TaxID=1825666 RepID=A0AAD9M759_9PEZI|nr:hypothetical protein P8C59_000899 [Phyllachora maydis]